MAEGRRVRRQLIRFSLTLPGAFEDHPWDETVAKVKGKGKVFVFFGMDEGGEPGMSVKLDESQDQALAVPGATPTGYGLGRAGWVSVPFGDSAPPLPVLKDWIEESYRRVAPKALVAELDARAPRR